MSDSALYGVVPPALRNTIFPAPACVIHQEFFT